GVLSPDGSQGPGIGFIDSGGSGSGGGSGGSGAYDGSAVPLGCGLYTKLCGGKCIPIAVDPQNCGDCGKVCGPTEICSASACVPASKGCVPPPQGGDPALTICARSCVDTLNDSNNCGTPTGTSACGHACPASQGCVNGACVPQLPVATTPPNGCGECLNDLARATFRWALCSCGDVALQQQLFTDAYDSTKGPYPPAPLQTGGGVGVNGNFTGGGAPISIGGALWCTGAAGVATGFQATVSQETHVANALNATGGALKILDNAWVGGNVGGTVNISKTLYVPTTATVGAGVTSAMTVKQPVTVAPPCDCSDTALLGQSIDQIVTAHATNNDNAAIGLNAGALATPTMSTRLDLPCGRYYLTGINQPGTSVTVFAHGRTSLFIRGDVVGATVSFVLDPTATFDTFITGTVKASGQLIVGSPNYPALSRTYVGGTAPVDLSGEAGRTAGNLYVGKTPLNVSSHFVLYGGLIAASLANQENIEIHYDRAVLDLPKCGPPPPMCQGCKDCGNDPCINGMCSPTCTSSTQCCAPLICAGGKCQVIGTAL
ncbi:MAG: hypothetical protein M3O46_22755, partial [Myxococcota bacterium]|nr:hypothetical protein [Myxococcota bacterium]